MMNAKNKIRTWKNVGNNSHSKLHMVPFKRFQVSLTL